MGGASIGSVQFIGIVYKFDTHHLMSVDNNSRVKKGTRVNIGAHLISWEFCSNGRYLE